MVFLLLVLDLFLLMFFKQATVKRPHRKCRIETVLLTSGPLYGLPFTISGDA